MAEMIKIKLVRSTNSVPAKLRKVAEGLGLRKIDQVVTRPDNDAIRGMVAKIPHLVEVQQ
ncbi:MAG: 50S ribosomal protein L30 [Acidobacteria bacterium]|nr:50S ribosomal protein L30 [Acidobacteriota bacterium]